MTYSINVSGHHPGGEEGEKRLHAELAEMLGKPEHGVSHSHFGGQHVQGTIHLHNSHETQHEHHAKAEHAD